ncbi:MAG: energy transducer TonB, partial [Nitrospirota bacterium]
SGEAGKGPSAPSSPSPGSNGVEGTPRRLIRPSEEDLERYAKLDKETEKSKADSITLDTEDLMSTAYMHSLKTRIEMIWKYPETARRDGLEGNLVMQFTIAKSGKISGIELLKSSGYPMLDEAAKQALLDASPYNPLPQSWKKDSFTITGTFIYTLYGGLSRGFNLDDIE